jgi:hypothetical protein
MAFRIDIPWEQPPEPTAALCPFQAHFEIESMSGDFDADEELHALWERYRLRHPEHLKEFARRLVALYRGVAWSPGMPYSADLPRKEILELTKKATVVVYRTEFGGEKNYWLRVEFELEWDDEHAYALPFDEDTETFGDWED